MFRAVVVGVAVLAFPAQAAAEPVLTAREACRVAGRVVHSEYANIEVGSGPCFTQRHPRLRDRRLVDKFYRDLSGQCFVMGLGIRETARHYRYRILFDRRAWSRRCG